MDNDYDSLELEPQVEEEQFDDEPIENIDEENQESIDEEELDEEQETIDNQKINPKNIDYKKIDQSPDTHMRELGKATLATPSIGVGANAYNKFTQSNLGKALMNRAGNKLPANPNNNPLNNIGKYNQIGQYQSGNNMETEPLPTSNALPTNPLVPKSSSLNTPKNPLESLITAAGKNNSTSLFGKKTASIPLLGKKKFLLLKLKLIGVGLAILGFMFVFILLCNVLDIDQQNFLELTTWNTSGGGTTAGTVNSDTNFSNTDKEELKNSLIDKIGEEGITELTTKINNSGNNKCDGINVANKLVTLIDEIGTKGYKIPYGNYSKDNYQIINSDWGKTSEDGSIIGLNEFGVIDWALNTANINNPATSMNDYKDRTRIIDLEYANPGDLVMFDNKAYIILQNTGTNITTAYTDTSGLTYKKYTYNDLSSSTAIDMNSYYKDNCKN